MNKTQKRINYSDVMELGFTEDIVPDAVYEAHYGFPYSIITLDLTKKIYIEWHKETGLAEIVRTNKNHEIQATRPVWNLEHLTDLVNFFLEVDDDAYDDDTPYLAWEENAWYVSDNTDWT